MLNKKHRRQTLHLEEEPVPMRKTLRQRFHLEPPAGLLNDPNGLAWYRGVYHVYFQWNKFEKNHSYKEWGSFASDDLVHWQFQGSALVPDQPYDQNGVYSGSALEIDGKLCLYYTGNVKHQGLRNSRQCLAVTEDGRRYLKLGPVLEKPDGYTPHFRDPKVFRGESGWYYMLIGAQQASGRGALALARSRDGLVWDQPHPLAFSQNYEMIECPDLFSLDGQAVLLYCPQARNNDTDTCLSSYSAYKPVTFDEETGTLSPADADLDQGLILTDGGFDFYSPQTFVDGKGRRLLFAWMSRMEEAEEQAFAAGNPSVHCLTMPRVLHWREGRLWQTPPEELYSLLGEPIRPSELSHRAFWLDIRPTAGDEPFRLTFHRGEAALEFDPAARTLIFTRTGWLTGRPESKTCPLDHLDRLEIWSDSSSLELFINGGSTVLSSRIYPTSETLGLDVRGVDGCGITLRPIRTI